MVVFNTRERLRSAATVASEPFTPISPRIAATNGAFLSDEAVRKLIGALVIVERFNWTMNE